MVRLVAEADFAKPFLQMLILRLREVHHRVAERAGGRVVCCELQETQLRDEQILRPVVALLVALGDQHAAKVATRVLASSRDQRPVVVREKPFSAQAGVELQARDVVLEDRQ
jgi:hypothetical protein